MEGSQATVIIARLLIKLIEILDRIRREYLERSIRRREMGCKKKSTLWRDKRQIGVAKSFKKNLIKREADLDKKLSEHKYKFDLYKLDMQSKLEDYNVEIKKAEKALEIANRDFKNGECSKDKIAAAQIEMNLRLEAKRKFEIQANKALLEKDRECSELKKTYDRVKEDIKICDKAIDAFSSKFTKQTTESLKANFEDVAERQMNTSETKEELSLDDTVSQDKYIDININNDITDRPDKDIDIKSDIDNNNKILKEYLEQQRREALHNNREKSRNEIER